MGLILIGAFLVSYIISHASLWLLRQSHFYKPSYLTNGIKQTDFDYIILGASTGLTTLNTHTIDSVLHTEGLNLSVDDTALPSQYLMLQHFLAQGKRTDYCILAPNPKNYNTRIHTLSDNDYRFIMYANRPYVNGYYKLFSGTRANILKHSSWLPVLGVSYYNAELLYPSLYSFIKPKSHNRFDDKGNYTYPNKSFIDSPIKSFKPSSITFENEYVQKIKDLCDLHGITMICYITPMKGLKALVDNKNYHIINHSDLLKNSSFFHDIIHINTSGRKKASLQFAADFLDYLKQP
ncbi:hypothetical protein [Hanstruepera ponticola]|uniref:hypothetical protein n=1 Tax=Hanstruepera ponticola TaxID=2042995 RepID=UPI0013C48B35|nr:hypothetical protein [Hanstruepera ponticola]